MTQSELVGGWIGHWSPGIGDPTVLGWLTVVLYAFGAWQSYQLSTKECNLPLRRERTLWWVLALGLGVLGINKQLDLQTAVTEIGRIVAMKQGWYERRHEVQVEFIYAVTAIAVSIAITLGYFTRKAPLATICALAGSICLLTYVVIRAASFHKVDHFIRSEFLGFRMNWILEIGGICTIIASARWRLRTNWRSRTNI